MHGIIICSINADKLLIIIIHVLIATLKKEKLITCKINAK